MSGFKGQLLRRFGAGLLDGALELTGGILGSYFGAMVAALVTVTTPGLQPEVMQSSMKSGLGIGFAFWSLSISFLNRVMIQGISRSSIGKKAFKLELIASGEPLTWPKMIFRWILSIGSFASFGAGYWFVWFNAERRTLHDLVAGTDVVTEFEEGATVIELPRPKVAAEAEAQAPADAGSDTDDTKKAA
ncbi:RDD family protein [bacterium]|nr:RDD family protein [bacterium]